MISPIFIGSGLRTKILEALARGIPIISTSIEKNLITSLMDGHDIYITDSLNSFLVKTIKLLKDASSRKSISQNAKQQFNNHLEYNLLIQSRIDCYN